MEVARVAHGQLLQVHLAREQLVVHRTQARADLVRIFTADCVEVQALQGLTLRVDSGELVAIVGASGSGKSTLLGILSGLDTPTAGQVSVAGRDLLALSARERVDYRRHTVGFVWQQTSRNLLGYLTARENIALTMSLARTPDRERRSAELLDLLEVSHCADRLPTEMSGGEQQRVAIAVGLANDPRVLLADEPTGELDEATSAEVLEAMRGVNRELGVTTLIVTHDPAVSDHVARTVQTLEDAGVAGLHIEDQVNPKRCGHLDGKQVVDEDTALKRIRSAADARRDPNLLIMARTDIRAVEGLGAAIDRAKALVDAGADAIFPEAMADLGEFEAVRGAVDVPILANMTEFGKSDLFTVDQLRDVGVNIVIWPVSLLRLAMGAAERGLDQLLAEGSLKPLLGEMQHRADLYDLIDYEGYNAFDTSVYNFEVRR